MLPFVPSDDLCNAFADQSPSIDASCRQTTFITPGIYSAQGGRDMDKLRQHMREHVHVMIGTYAREVEDGGLKWCPITEGGVLLPDFTTFMMSSMFTCDEAALEALYRRLSDELRAWIVAQGHRVVIPAPSPFVELTVNGDGEIVMTLP